MNQPQEQRVQITLDCKKNRIRFWKDMLPLMDNPRYIQLMVNPEKSLIALHGVDKAQGTCEVVNIKKGQHNHEIYSKLFVQKLCELSDGLAPGKTYRLVGYMYPADRVAVFPLRTAEVVES